MTATEFLTLGFTLACIIGPFVGLVVLIALQLMGALDKRGFSVTLGLPPRGEGGRYDGK